MSKLWYRTRDDQGASHLHDVDLNRLVIDRPTVIYMSGFLTTNNQPGFIAGAIKRLEEMLAYFPVDGAAQPSAQIYAWSHSSLANLFNLAAYSGLPERRSSKAGFIFARHVLLPLVATDLRTVHGRKITGRKLDREEARKNLRNLTLLTYSAGSVTAQESFNAARRLMRHVGYTDSEARDVLGEVVLISTGNVSRPSREANRFTTLYLVASNDLIIRAKNALWAPLRTLASKVFRQHPDALRMEEIGSRSLLTTARITNAKWEWRLGPNGTTWRSKIKRLIPAWALINSNHELPYYVTHDESMSPFANIALYALSNAIGRTRRLGVDELLAPPNDRPEDEVALYKAKVTAAKVKVG